MTTLDNFVNVLTNRIDELIDQSHTFNAQDWEYFMGSPLYVISPSTRNYANKALDILAHAYYTIDNGILVFSWNVFSSPQHVPTGKRPESGIVIAHSSKLTKEEATEILIQFKSKIKELLYSQLREWTLAKDWKREIPTIFHKEDETKYNLYYKNSEENVINLCDLIACMYLHYYPKNYKDREIWAFDYHHTNEGLRPIAKSIYMWVNKSFDLQQFFGDICQL